MRPSIRRLVLTFAASAGVAGGTVVSAAVNPVEAASAGGRVYTNGEVLNVRLGPSTSHTRVDRLANRTELILVCQEPGEKIRGKVRTTRMWDRLPDGTYVTDAYVSRGATVPPTCAQWDAAHPTPPPPGGGSGRGPASTRWTVPVAGDVGSAFRTRARPSHDGVDIPAPRNTPIRAAAGGKVVTAECDEGNCDVDGSMSTPGCGWYVEIQHLDRVVTRYCHLVRRPSVSVGQRVASGQTIGYVGTSGHSSGLHLHFEVHLGGPPANQGNAVDPVPFMASKGAPLG